MTSFNPHRPSSFGSSLDDSFLSPLPFDAAYCDLFMNDFAFGDPFNPPLYSLDDSEAHSPQNSSASHHSTEADSPTLSSSSASSLSTREDSNHNTTHPSILQSPPTFTTSVNESHQPSSRPAKRKAPPTPTLSVEPPKPAKQLRPDFSKSHFSCAADEVRVIHHFTTAIRNITSRPSTPYTDADCLYTIAHLMDVMRPDLFRQFLTGLGYSPTPSPCPHDADRAVWRSNLRLPTVTLPHRMSMDWSRSPQKALPDEPHSLNIATLVCQRPEAVTLHKFREGFVALDASPTKLFNDQLLESCEPVTLDQVDVSACSIPISAQVNCAFERLFGYTQSEIRSLFLREGKQALYVLNDREELHEIHRKNIKAIMEGQTECCWSININTKYGSQSLRTLIMMKQFMNDSSCTMKRLAMWVPLPRDG